MTDIEVRDRLQCKLQGIIESSWVTARWLDQYCEERELHESVKHAVLQPVYGLINWATSQFGELADEVHP